MHQALQTLHYMPCNVACSSCITMQISSAQMTAQLLIYQCGCGGRYPTKLFHIAADVWERQQLRTSMSVEGEHACGQWPSFCRNEDLSSHTEHCTLRQGALQCWQCQPCLKGTPLARSSPGYVSVADCAERRVADESGAAVCQPQRMVRLGTSNFSRQNGGRVCRHRQGLPKLPHRCAQILFLKVL